MVAESFLLALLLTLAGGFLDAYTFCCHGQVFANAQTGNIVMVGVSFASKNIAGVIHYFIPIMAFSIGVLVAMIIRDRHKEETGAVWRQKIIIIEIFVAMSVSFIPEGGAYDVFANVLVSFLCALQAESFRKVSGKVFASTMCTGNLRSCTECFYQSLVKKDKKSAEDAKKYFIIIFTFILGAALGVAASAFFKEKAILTVEIPLFCALCFLIWKKG